MSEEIKAPEIEGFELCSYDEHISVGSEDRARVSFLGSMVKELFYKRIKPKEKKY